LYIDEERPPGYRVRVAVQRNDKLKENLVIEYEYHTRILSTTATRDIIKGSGSTYSFNASNVEEYHNADIEMFDKLVRVFRKRCGFRLQTEGERVIDEYVNAMTRKSILMQITKVRAANGFH
jgi:hypothetical protein